MTNTLVNKASANTKYAKAFYSTFLVALLIAWGPINALAYIMPILCLGWFILQANSGKTLLYLFSFLLLFSGIILFYETLYYNTQDINFQVGGAILTLITYSSFIFLIVVPGNLYHSQYSYLRYATIIKYLILIQATLGIIQLFCTMALKSFSFDGAMGDKVQGTISPLSFLTDKADFGNMAFATNMVFLLLFFAPYVFVYNRGKLIMAWGAFSVLCASVLHILLAIVGAIFIVGFFFRRFSKVSYKVIYVLVFVVIGSGLLARLQPANFAQIQNYAIIYAKAKSPKVTSTIDVVTQVPNEYPTMLFLGFGPGQYSSRASLIATGKYLGGMDNNKNYFFLPNDMTEPFKEYLWDDWLESTNQEAYGGSAMSKPFYSIMSVYTEFGLIALGAILIYIIYRLTELRRVYLKPASSEKDKFSKFLAFSTALSLLFLLFVCFIENYLEISQAIFPGLLMVKYFHSQIYSTESVS
jgi:hypothetical protein